MTLERIAVATAVISTTVSAGGLLLTWYRGSTRQRPRLARTLGGLTVVSAAALAVGLAFARTGEDAPKAGAARGALTAAEYRLRLIGICEDYTRQTDRFERAEGARPAYAISVILEPRAIAMVKRLHPPAELAGRHQRLLDLWGRRVSLLGNFYDRVRRESHDLGFQREFRQAIRQIDALSRQAQKELGALGVTPECNLF
jgi:hypothetical protein